MSVPSIQSALQQMQALASQASGQTSRGQHVDTAVGKGGFAGELHASIERINDLQQQAGAMTRAFEAGDPSVSLNELMLAREKSSLAFQMGVQVRNRLVTAYKDIMNMQV